jgi:hypothetical protein
MSGSGPVSVSADRYAEARSHLRGNKNPAWS